jgi:hypothetical protein
MSISTQENFPRKEISTFNNEIFGKVSVRGNFSWVEMGLNYPFFPKKSAFRMLN